MATELASTGRGRLDGKRVIVSGAARGIGAAITQVFALEGACVLATDIRDELGEEMSRAVRGLGGRVVYQRLDVRLTDDWASAVKRCEEELGPPNVLVNNAFRYSHPNILEISDQEWADGLDINLTGGFHGIRAVLPGMLERKQGTIVTVSSENGNEMSLTQQVGYQAAKAGLSAITRHVAVTYGREGIRANSIHPGPVRTPALEEANFLDMAEFIATGFPIARLAEPEEIAMAALYLASDESSYVTGSALLVDGGSIATLNFPGRETGTQASRPGPVNKR